MFGVIVYLVLFIYEVYLVNKEHKRANDILNKIQEYAVKLYCINEDEKSADDVEGS